MRRSRWIVALAHGGELTMQAGDLVEPALNLIQGVEPPSVDVLVAKLKQHLREATNRTYDIDRIVLTSR